MNLFENLQLMKEANSNNFKIVLPWNNIKTNTMDEQVSAGKKYDVDVAFNVHSNNEVDVFITGAPEDVKKYIDDEYSSFKDVVNKYEYELKKAYKKYNPDANEDEINAFLYDSNEVVENVMYGIDFRNMHTAIHGLIVFEDIDEALSCAERLDETKDGETLEYYNYYDVIEEIDYRDFENTNNGKFYDNIKIVNDVSIDLYNI